MADVKWIKITTDIFDDEKILLIESFPEADSIIVIWFKLLCLAGKMNNSGVFVMNDKIPYTDKMLATIFRRKETTVQMALQTFEQFGMIEIMDGVITIPNWGKHQSLDQLENKREYMKNYMQDYREKQKQLSCKTNCKTNSKANVRQADKNKKRIEEDKNINNNVHEKPSKAELDDFFESVWKLYPNKRGKGAVSDTQKRKLYKIGYEALAKAIDRYQEDLKATPWKNMQNGSKFFNSGYVDYLDENYEPCVQQVNGNGTKEKLEGFYDMAASWAEEGDS
jgi:predicted phage replisome organizer